MPQIKPINEVNMNEISELCHNNSEPVFITKKGYGDLVVMSIEDYEHQQTMMELYNKLGEAEVSFAEGKELLDGDTVFQELREKYAR